MKYTYFVAFFKKINKKNIPSNAEITLEEKIVNINQVKEVEKFIKKDLKVKEVVVISYVLLREVEDEKQAPEKD